MSQISKSTTIPAVRKPASNLRWTALFATAAVAVAAVSVGIALQGGRGTEGEPTQAGVGAAAALGRIDDYGTRHAAQAAALGRADDYGTRHAPQAAALGRSDDFALRQRDAAAQPIPPLSRIDDYGTRHAIGR